MVEHINIENPNIKEDDFWVGRIIQSYLEEGEVSIITFYPKKRSAEVSKTGIKWNIPIEERSLKNTVLFDLNKTDEKIVAKYKLCQHQ